MAAVLMTGVAVAVLTAVVHVPAAAVGDVPAAIDTLPAFSHTIHADAKKMGGKDLTCASCHQMVTATGQCPKQEVRYPDHDACVGCHAANFYEASLTICVNCHKTAQFKADNPLKELNARTTVTPFRSEFSHAAHVNAGNCTSCHAFVKAGLQVEHPSHPNCCQCHTDAAVQPTMNNCAGCHNESRFAGRRVSKLHDFSHKNHREDPRTGMSTECTQCHVNTNGAKNLRQIPAPPMHTCVGCHDGTEPGEPHPTLAGMNGSGAFSYTACNRCHSQSMLNKLAAVPADHAAPGTP
jgi:Cytochrome c7 and related cytochrome c